jgi:hypothetical protein
VGIGRSYYLIREKWLAVDILSVVLIGLGATVFPFVLIAKVGNILGPVLRTNLFVSSLLVHLCLIGLEITSKFTFIYYTDCSYSFAYKFVQKKYKILIFIFTLLETSLLEVYIQYFVIMVQ